jgi:hypothetical protein
LEAYAPVLSYDADEELHAISPGAATDFYDTTDDSDDPDAANRLIDSNGSFASANPLVALDEEIDVLDLAFLGEHYIGVGPRGATAASSTDVLSERGDGGTWPFFSSEGYVADAETMEGRPGYAHRIYGRVVHGDDEDGRLWLQYWFFYYFDSQGNAGSGVHEGDWEMIQVGLNASRSPESVAYAQHGTGEKCPWSEVTKDAGRPVVYVAQASHASYVRPGYYEDPDPDDDANGDGLYIYPTLEVINSHSPAWVSWPGRWGDSGGSSPQGPAFQGKWADPSGWADGLSPCDVD